MRNSVNQSFLLWLYVGDSFSVAIANTLIHIAKFEIWDSGNFLNFFFYKSPKMWKISNISEQRFGFSIWWYLHVFSVDSVFGDIISVQVLDTKTTEPFIRSWGAMMVILVKARFNFGIKPFLLLYLLVWGSFKVQWFLSPRDVSKKIKCSCNHRLCEWAMTLIWFWSRYKIQ